jgi:hypothetical protein
VVLLGSEEAVRRYIDDDSAPAIHLAETSAQRGADPSAPRDLFGVPIPQKPKQKRLF